MRLTALDSTENKRASAMDTIESMAQQWHSFAPFPFGTGVQPMNGADMAPRYQIKCVYIKNVNGFPFRF